MTSTLMFGPLRARCALVAQLRHEYVAAIAGRSQRVQSEPEPSTACRQSVLVWLKGRPAWAIAVGQVDSV
jgi:hypothetical protein